MATVYQPIKPESGVPFSTTFPELAKIDGTNFPVISLKFDAALDEAAYFPFPIFNYGSGGVFVFQWEADTAIVGDIVIEIALAAITPGTDTQDVETKAFATAQKATGSHGGTTGQRINKLSIPIVNLDSLATLDNVWVRVRRLGASDPNDTMAGDAQMLDSFISYSDT